MAVRNRVSVAISIIGLILGTGGLSVSMASLASADSTSVVNGCTFEMSASTWTLQSNCNSTGQINVPTGITLDGGDFTISPTYQRDTSRDIWGAIEISSAPNVTIRNLTIDATISNNLHGINIYNSTNVKIDHLIVKNMGHTGINVNSSTVSVSDVTTANNGWEGIDVDQKISAPAILSIVGPMTQTDAVQIFVDDVKKTFTVNDYLHQYSVTPFVYQVKGVSVTGAVYTRIYATDKQTCKDGGWKLGLSATQSVENQGQCVAFFAKGEKSKMTSEKD